jgi:hypothetical protein
VKREKPGYIERKEYKRNRLRVKAGKRVAKFEDKWMEEKSAGEITKNTEKKEREKYYQRNGYACEEVERLKEQKEDG